MRRLLLPALGASALLAAVLVACSSSAPKPDEKKLSGQPATPTQTLASGFEPANFDKNVRPQDDLFRAVNGGWIAKTEIPPDRSGYGAFGILADKTELDLRAILDPAHVEGLVKEGLGQAERSAQVRNFFEAYMDDKRVDELGMKPISEELAAIRALETKADLAKRLGALRRIGVGGAFDISVVQDAKNSSAYILDLSQEGLGLPDRDFYLSAQYKDKLEAYAPHVTRMLRLAGIDAPERAAESIVALETEIARTHWSKEECRDDVKTYNKMTRVELAKLAPGFEWDAYMEAVGAKDATAIVVAQPSALTGLGKLFEETPLETWKAWLSWHLVHHFADLLSSEVAQTDFAFYGTKLWGTPEQRPRWKRAVSAVESHLGEALGKLYVEKHYPPEAARRMEALVGNLIATYRERVKNLEWMSAETKEKALAKLDRFNPKIGHPKKWRDYSRIEVRRDDLVGNVRRASAFEWDRNLAKLGKPVDRDEWQMTPETVNAYYDSSMNEIVFPAAILQPPFFDLSADDAINYGGIGAVIGHEIGHGFDDQGSKWDGAGNLTDWWTEKDRAEFDRRGAMLAAQYDRFEPLPGFHVNGRLTLGENLADLAGATVAHAAYRRSLEGKEAPVIDGLTGDQRFFMGFAQIWRSKHRDDALKGSLATDPHSPGEYRANGIVKNVAAFYEAFSVKEGDRMFLPASERVRIW